MSPFGFARRLIDMADASLRARLVIPAIVLATVSAGLMIFIATEFHGVDMRREHRSGAELFSGLTADALANTMADGAHGDTSGILRDLLGHRPDLRDLSVVGEDGRVTVSTTPVLRGQQLWRSAEDVISRPIDAPDGHGFAIARSLPNERRCAGCHGLASRPLGWVYVRFDTDRIQATQRELLSSLALAAVPSVGLLLALLWWLLGREAVRPIQRLVAAMRRAERGTLNVLADEGRPDEIGVAARKFDATLAALRRSEAELKKAYEGRMERADRFAMIGEMATGLAHEIKNPLAGLSGALELLAEDLAANPQQSDVVGEMRHQVKRLADIMGGLLSVARPPRARMEDTDVNQAIEKVFFLVGQQRAKTPVKVSLQLDRSVPRVNADPGQLEQVFLNIGLNAFQAVSVEGGTIAVRSLSLDDQVVVEFTDTGPGIPADVRPHIFTPFFTTRASGTGLGLALSQRLVSEHGGKLWFECPETGGTVFFVSLPAKPMERVSR